MLQSHCTCLQAHRLLNLVFRQILHGEIQDRDNVYATDRQTCGRTHIRGACIIQGVSAAVIFSASSLIDWNSTEDRYRSPKLGSTVTTSLPSFSGRLATLIAATVAAPDEMPHSKPSSSARRRAMATESSLDTCAYTKAGHSSQTGVLQQPLWTAFIT